MGLLSNLTSRVKHWWKPRYTRGHFYEVTLWHGGYAAYQILIGKNKDAMFYFTDIHLNDDDSVSFDVKHIFGQATDKEVEEVFMDFLQTTLQNHNELREEVLNDNTEECGSDNPEVAPQERSIRP